MKRNRLKYGPGFKREKKENQSRNEENETEEGVIRENREMKKKKEKMKMKIYIEEIPKAWNVYLHVNRHR